MNLYAATRREIIRWCGAVGGLCLIGDTLSAEAEPVSATSAVDHLLLGVADLDQGIAWVEKATGVKAVIGGSHPGVGTRNALLALGGRRYLELIAPDPAQTAYNFQIDIRKLAAPRLITWAAAASDVEAVASKARAAGYQVFGPRDGSRARPDGKTLKWRSAGVQGAFGRDGVEPVPFFIEWAADSPHPSQDSPQGCELRSLALAHPEAAKVQAALRALGIDLTVKQAASARFTAVLETPKGRVELS